MQGIRNLKTSALDKKSMITDSKQRNEDFQNWKKNLKYPKRPDTIKLLEENRALSDISHSNTLFEQPPTVIKTKNKNKQMRPN